MFDLSGTKTFQMTRERLLQLEEDEFKEESCLDESWPDWLVKAWSANPETELALWATEEGFVVGTVFNPWPINTGDWIVYNSVCMSVKVITDKEMKHRKKQHDKMMREIKAEFDKMSDKPQRWRKVVYTDDPLLKRTATRLFNKKQMLLKKVDRLRALNSGKDLFEVFVIEYFKAVVEIYIKVEAWWYRW